MNELSWMIYLAGVVGEVRAAAVITLVLGGLAASGVAVFGLLARHDYPEDAEWAVRFHAKCARLWWLPFAIMGFVAITPSEGTIYAIAASEMGEDILNSETGGKAVKALDAWLDKQIEGE
jgi:uncharacterized membrane protein